MYNLYFETADQQGSIAMGEYVTRESAEAAIPGAREELLEQCGEDDQRKNIMAGSWTIQ